MVIFAFAISLSLAIVFNVRAGARYRETLAEKLHALRLNTMLSALGINVSEYLHTVSTVTINKQIDSCAECASTEKCDDNLSNNTITINDIDFCNNESSLKNMLAKQHIAE